MKGFAVLTVVFWCCLFSFGCGQDSRQNYTEQNEEEAVRSKAEKKSADPLRFYNWEDYIGAKTLEKFTKESGIEVQLETFKDEEWTRGALQSGAITADLVVVSQSLALEMLEAKLLQPVDYRKIPNSIHLKPKFNPAPDQQGYRYWFPYLWGTTGLVVNTRYVTDDYRSWSVLWQPAYKGKIAMLNNGFEVVASASKMLGYSVNPTMDQLEEISQVLLRQKELVNGYLSAPAIMDKMRDESLWAAQIYNGDGMAVADEFEHIRFVTPREGAALWTDVFVIPRNSRQPEEAHAFINFIHNPEIVGAIASEYWYASTNAEAERFMADEVLQAEEVYPSQDVLEKSEFFGRMGGGDSVRKRVQIWTMLQNE